MTNYNNNNELASLIYFCNLEISSKKTINTTDFLKSMKSYETMHWTLMTHILCYISFGYNDNENRVFICRNFLKTLKNGERLDGFDVIPCNYLIIPSTITNKYFNAFLLCETPKEQKMYILLSNLLPFVSKIHQFLLFCLLECNCYILHIVLYCLNDYNIRVSFKNFKEIIQIGSIKIDRLCPRSKYQIEMTTILINYYLEETNITTIEYNNFQLYVKSIYTNCIITHKDIEKQLDDYILHIIPMSLIEIPSYNRILYYINGVPLTSLSILTIGYIRSVIDETTLLTYHYNPILPLSIKTYLCKYYIPYIYGKEIISDKGFNETINHYYILILLWCISMFLDNNETQEYKNKKVYDVFYLFIHYYGNSFLDELHLYYMLNQPDINRILPSYVMSRLLTDNHNDPQL